MSGDITQRIEALLGELEELSRGARDVPSSVLVQALATLEKARCVLKNCPRTESAAEDDGEDPQPDVDRDALERMYRDLGSGRPAPRGRSKG
jgi:hypothetical protein